MIQVGQGFDVHAFEECNERAPCVTLGGVKIPFDKSLKAHSDGDVLVHALCDALLGAAALGDIGRHFPDHDPRYQDISSLDLLATVMTMLKAEDWQFGNADMTIIAEAPKIAPHAEAMIDQLTRVMACQREQLNIKATTSEKLGFTGRGEGLACQAIVLLHNGEHV
jgi:2-C-methyl-D-erythritol 2,4-cyclodiphosphate synthase